MVVEEQFNSDTNAFLQGQYYTYNSYGDVATSTLKVANQAPIKYVCTYGYESVSSTQKLNVLSWQAQSSGYKVSYGYDGLGRALGQYIFSDPEEAGASSVLTRSYSYLAGANGGTTGLVSGITYSGKSISAYTYTYDARGNITEVRKNGSLVASYAYDDLNQLVRENNVAANKTWVYTYDKRGNILSRKTYAYTTGTLGTVQNTDTYEYFEQSSSYLWGDGLVRYNGGFNVYDAIGNPTQYENGNTFYFTWENGRQLVSGTKGATEFAYTYNADGLRTQKVVDGVITDYYWAGSQLTMMVITNGTSVKTLKFYYDAEGRPMCLDYNGTMYFYITNLQGDVVALADQYGEVIHYEYDAWGKPIISEYYFSSHSEVMQYNPLRYRGYIYDNETGFYYLQSRYYDPVVGRFINSDGYVSTGTGVLGYNMFAYCNNNPILYVDISGCNPAVGVLGALGLGAGSGAGVLLLAAGLTFIAFMCITDNADAIYQDFADICYGIAEAVESLTDALTDAKVKEEEKVEENSPSSALYYGAQYRDNVWSCVTGPMTLEEAIIWTNATAASNVYGKNASWGVYTQNQEDAKSYMDALQPKPSFSEVHNGGYPHYHYADRTFGIYKHFHAWYGEIKE